MKQEPTAWINKERDVITFDNLFPEMTPLYEKREWVGLTDEEIESAIDDGFAFGLSDGNISNEYVIRYVRVIESKLKELNT